MRTPADFQPFLVELTTLNARCHSLGLHATGQVLHEAVRKAGWEVAQLLEGDEKKRRAEDRIAGADFIHRLIKAGQLPDFPIWKLSEEGWIKRTVEGRHRVRRAAAWLAAHSDMAGYIFFKENDELNLDPWRVIDLIDQEHGGDRILLQYGRAGEMWVEPTFSVWVEDRALCRLLQV